VGYVINSEAIDRPTDSIMIKNLGFTRFEFYFVISVISIITLIALQRYLVLVEETRRFSFEINARNFSAAVYNFHAQWILAHQHNNDLSSLHIDGVDIEFSQVGWPVAVISEKNIVREVSITACLSLWQHFLQNSPSVSFTENTYGTQDYHLRVHNKNTCRYEFLKSPLAPLFFDYTPASGDFVISTQPLISK
jgi:hypothetical protein